MRREVDDDVAGRGEGFLALCAGRVAAEALGRYGNEADIKVAVATLLELASADRNGFFVALAALTGLDAIGARAGLDKQTLGKLTLGSGRH